MSFQSVVVVPNPHETTAAETKERQMKRRFGLAFTVLALVAATTGPVSPAHAQQARACTINGTITPQSPMTLTTTSMPFTGSINANCVNGPSGTMTMSGLLQGTCTAWVATATAASASLWGSASATVTLTPPTGFSASASLNLKLTYTLMANGTAGVSCLGTTTTVNYWAVSGGMVIVTI